MTKRSKNIPGKIRARTLAILVLLCLIASPRTSFCQEDFDDIPSYALDEDESVDIEGAAYGESRGVYNLAPLVALGTISIAAIIAIASQTSHHHSSRSHRDRSYYRSYYRSYSSHGHH